jgi:hypothetical protein
VYCAISRPIPKTNQKTGLEKFVPLNPELLMVCANTKCADWWCVGTNAQANTITSTPTMCHQAETELISASSRTPFRFSSRWAAMMHVKVRKTVCLPVLTLGNQRFISDVQKIAAPSSITAVTPICPIRLNQPVNHPQAGEPIFEAQ